MIKYVIIFILLISISIYSFATEKSEGKMSNDKKIEITNLTISKGSLTFDYKIKNTLSKDIWICNDVDVDAYSNLAWKVTEDRLIISIKHLTLPKSVMFDKTVQAKYVRVPKGSDHLGEILISLPVYDYPQFGVYPQTSEKKNKKTLKYLNHIVFEIGFFEEDLSKPSQGLMLTYEPNNVILLGHLWEGMDRERIFKTDIQGVKIPCYLPGSKCLYKTKKKPSQLVKLEIQNPRISEGSFQFNYTVINNCKEDIWICEDILMYDDIKAQTRIEENKLIVRLGSLDVPKYLYFTESLLAKYVRLPPGFIYKGKLSLKLPISLSPILDDDISEIYNMKQKTIKEIQDIVFEVGFFTASLLSKSSTNIRELSRDVILIDHLWEQLGKEAYTKICIKDIRVSCYVIKESQGGQSAELPD